MSRSGDMVGGFADPVFDSQSVFRALLGAMSRPGTIHRARAWASPPAPLSPTSGAVLLALSDVDTAVFLDVKLATPSVADWLRFHSGAPIVEEPSAAAFAVIGDARAMPDLAAFAQGSAEYPDRSTTIVLETMFLSNAPDGFRLRGPGIDGVTHLNASALGDAYPAVWRKNRARFPLGVDVILTAPDAIAGLPRTTDIEARDAVQCT